MTEFLSQSINIYAVVMLVISFGMISQRRVLMLVRMFALQGIVLVAATLTVAHLTGDHHLYYSAALTFAFKVVILPSALGYIVKKLDIKWDVDTLMNIPVTMLIGMLLVMFAFHLSGPIAALSHSIAKGTLGLALACILLSFLMLIVRSKAVPQVVAFLSMENALFFAAASATGGMPMVVELGIALDVLVALIILGVFMFQIREQFDSLDLQHLEKLKED